MSARPPLRVRLLVALVDDIARVLEAALRRTCKGVTR